MKKSEEDSQDKLVRSLADYEAGAAAEARSKLIDERNSAFRWMIASLFAMNGGAILAIFGNENFGLNGSFKPFWVFFAGIVCTFFAVLCSENADRRMIAQLHSWGLHWATVKITGEPNSVSERRIREKMDDAETTGRIARIFIFFAMIFFVLGVLATAVMAQKAAVMAQKIAIEKLELEVEQVARELDRHRQ